MRIFFRVKHSARSIKFVVVAVIAIALGFGGVVLRARPSAAYMIRPAGPFEIEYVVSIPHQLPVRYQLDYTSAKEWQLTTVDGGEETGYYMRSERDGTVVAGYPQWKKPVVLSGPTKDITSPTLYFVPRAIQLGDIVPPSVSDTYVSAVADRLNLDKSELIYFEAAGESIVYSKPLGIPLSISYKDQGQIVTTFRVTSINT